MAADDLLERARSTLRTLRSADAVSRRDCEIGEECEESRREPDGSAAHASGVADPFLRWRLENAARMTTEDARLGHDPGGFCAEQHRWLTYPEQRRGACSWCVTVDPEREPEYWASHWQRFTERR